MCKVKFEKNRVIPIVRGILRVNNWEFKDYLLLGQVPVDLTEGVKLGLHVVLVLGIQKHLKCLAAIELETNALANNLGRVNNVLQNRLLNRGECPRARADALLYVLLGRGLLAVASLSKNSALGNENYVAAAALQKEKKVR